MKYNPAIHHRRSIRLKGYDYANPGAYFVTLCTCDRAYWFGKVADGEMRLNALGQVVADTWQWLAVQYPYVELDESIVMPNHFHGILIINPSRRGDSRIRVNNPQTRRGDSLIAPTPKISPPPSDSRRIAPTPKISQPSSDDRSKTKSLGRLIGTFKTVSTKQINQIRKTPGTPIWQRNYYEHIVRHETRLQQIRQYIVANPVSWQQDHLHPSITFDAIP